MPVIKEEYTKGHITEGSIFTWIGNLFKKKEDIPLTPIPAAHTYDPLTFVTPTAQYYTPSVAVPSTKTPELSFGNLSSPIPGVISERLPIQNYIIIGAALIFMVFIVLQKGKK